MNLEKTFRGLDVRGMAEKSGFLMVSSQGRNGNTGWHIQLSNCKRFQFF